MEGMYKIRLIDRPIHVFSSLVFAVEDISCRVTGFVLLLFFG